MERLDPQAIITLTTDFGADDAYVAAMKGVILDINPAATIVDISHSIEPQAVSQAAFVLSTACPYFPPDTVHLVVVDPGVGGRRRAVILETPTAIFVAPDNGVLSYVVQDSLGRPISRAGRTRLPPELEAFQITNRAFWREPVSPTFHGRDIFAPVAAHISLGKPLTNLGKPIATLNALPLPRPERDGAGNLLGHVVHIDRFGNLITDVTAHDLPPAGLRIEVAGQEVRSLSRCYEKGRGLLALVGSSGRLEIALPGGSAAGRLGVRAGDGLRICGRWGRHDRRRGP
jgi:S-adenosylmethionine hydrolase